MCAPVTSSMGGSTSSESPEFAQILSSMGGVYADAHLPDEEPMTEEEPMAGAGAAAGGRDHEHGSRRESLSETS